VRGVGVAAAQQQRCQAAARAQLQQQHGRRGAEAILSQQTLVSVPHTNLSAGKQASRSWSNYIHSQHTRLA
jgi:hypothetical protein